MGTGEIINLKRVKNVDELRIIPGVGKSIAQDLRIIGIKKVNDLRNRNPEGLYNDLCKRMGKPIDRCMLYVLRCAVYFASNTKHDPEKLKWWNWKDAGERKTNIKYKTQKERMVLPKIKLWKVKGEYPQQEEVIMTPLDFDRVKPKVKSKKNK